MTELTVRANAKINLTLGITGKRSDGYHLIDTIMQSIDLYDTLKVKESPNISVSCSIGNLNDQNNICYRAAKLFFDVSNKNCGAEIYIEKKIPTAAGLGGGSADAAAVLLALDKIYGTCFSYEKLCKIALKLGADVPFFIHGGTQRAQGIGEALIPLTSLKSGFFLLLKMENKPSTAEMYRQLDSINCILPDTDKAIKAINNNDTVMLAESLANSFTSVWKDSSGENLLKKTNPLGVSLSGSGPTWFALYNDFSSIQTAQKQLLNSGIECFSVKPCNNGIIFE